MLGRTKAATLEMLKRELGELKLAEIDRERIVMFGRSRAKAGAGPATVGMDIGMIKLVMQTALPCMESTPGSNPSSWVAKR